MFPSRLVLGIEADASFPNLIAGTSTISSPSIGAATYSEQVEFSGTVRGRLGYAPANWLIYTTGGIAWTYDEFTRTQVAGTPVGGTAGPGLVETVLMVPRAGWTLGGGAEVALPSIWTARAEYLFTDYGIHSVTFPVGAQRFDSTLAIGEFRLGLNYRLFGDSKKPVDPMTAPSVLETDNFAVHGQTTLLHQYDFPFRAPYRGANSLDPNIGRETWDVTAYAGWRLWSGAEL
jgi:high affinity Mn2+ porin